MASRWGHAPSPPFDYHPRNPLAVDLKATELETERLQ